MYFTFSRFIYTHALINSVACQLSFVINTLEHSKGGISGYLLETVKLEGRRR